jgi:hypothetical protein
MGADHIQIPDARNIGCIIVISRRLHAEGARSITIAIDSGVSPRTNAVMHRRSKDRNRMKLSGTDRVRCYPPIGRFIAEQSTLTRGIALYPSQSHVLRTQNLMLLHNVGNQICLGPPSRVQRLLRKLMASRMYPWDREVLRHFSSPSLSLRSSEHPTCSSPTLLYQPCSLPSDISAI